MYALIGIIILILVILILVFLYTQFKSKIEFYITGLDSKFSISDLNLLWNVAKYCELENPNALFFSLPALTKCMTKITSDASEEGNEKDPKIQVLLSKLFDFRTKLQNESDEKKGLNSTTGLEKGQKLRIILPGKGVFASKVLNNGKEIIVTVPRQKNLIPISSENWVGKVINVYLWRKGDARYVFDTTVVNHGLFIGESSISLAHSNNMIRTQKRRSVRAKCSINAMLYIIKEEVVDYSSVETQNGYKCIIEDVSESGAMIRIGGRGVPNVQIKLQYEINKMLIIMFGIVRTAEYNEAKNQSLLHFECIHIEPVMKNEVLSFVYNTLPQDEKEVFDAMTLTDADEKAEEAGLENMEMSDEAPDISNFSNESNKDKIAQANSSSVSSGISSDFDKALQEKINRAEYRPPIAEKPINSESVREEPVN
ncbi:MAG: PilZ domain-containing protein [Treponema sp.]|nr:PilZ domain-containing protein [Treponema sp.]